MYAFYYLYVCLLFRVNLHQLSVKKDPLEIQQPNLENSRRGFIKSVHER